MLEAISYVLRLVWQLFFTGGTQMSEGESKRKVPFRVEWYCETDSDEAVVFNYINSLGRDKRFRVVQLLQASFYPEAVYENHEVDSDHQRRIRTSIYWLQQRIGYLQKLEADLLGKDLKTSVEVGTTSAMSPSAIAILDEADYNRSTAQTKDEYIHSQSSQAGYISNSFADLGSGSSNPAGVSDDWDEESDEEESYNSFYDDDL